MFVTPIDREDIYALASALDDVVDYTEEVADYLGLYKIEAPFEQAQRLAHVLMQAARQISEAMPRLRDFGDMSHYTVEVNRLENDGDRITREAMAALFEGGHRPDGRDPLEGHLRAARERDRRHRDGREHPRGHRHQELVGRSVDSDLILVIVVAAALAFDFTNGFHDTANVVATSISTRAVPPKVAVGIAAILNFVGAFISLAVAATVAKGIVNADAITPTIVFAGLIGAIMWNLATWYFGLPSSSSHALIGGVVGAAFAAEGPSAIVGGGPARQGGRAGPHRPDARVRRGRASRS